MYAECMNRSRLKGNPLNIKWKNPECGDRILSYWRGGGNEERETSVLNLGNKFESLKSFHSGKCFRNLFVASELERSMHHVCNVQCIYFPKLMNELLRVALYGNQNDQQNIHPKPWQNICRYILNRWCAVENQMVTLTLNFELWTS